MNIALLTSDFLPNVGGMATHAHELAKAFARKKHLVHLVNPVYTEAEDLVEQFDDIVVHRLYVNNQTPRIKHVRYIWKTRSYLIDLKHRQQLEILHWHDLTPNCWTTRTLRKHFPLVWTNHTSNYLEYCESASGRRKMKRYLHHADAVISPSKELNEKSLYTGVDVQWLSYIPNGVDSKKFHPAVSPEGIREEYHLDPGKPVCICPRRLEPKNGVEYFIQSIPAVRARFPETQFLIVGGGFPDEKVRFEKYLLENNQRQGVVFTGNVPNTLMPRFYAISVIAVLPSLMEATSISGLEAMACGLPLIGTTVGGIPEIIEHEQSGMLIEPRNPLQLAERIIDLLNNPALRSRLGHAARRRVEEIFSWDVIADRTLDVYERVIHKRKQRH